MFFFCLRTKLEKKYHPHTYEQQQPNYRNGGGLWIDRVREAIKAEQEENDAAKSPPKKKEVTPPPPVQQVKAAPPLPKKKAATAPAAAEAVAAVEVSDSGEGKELTQVYIYVCVFFFGLIGRKIDAKGYMSS